MALPPKRRKAWLSGHSDKRLAAGGSTGYNRASDMAQGQVPAAAGRNLSAAADCAATRSSGLGLRENALPPPNRRDRMLLCVVPARRDVARIGRQTWRWVRDKSVDVKTSALGRKVACRLPPELPLHEKETKLWQFPVSS